MPVVEGWFHEKHDGEDCRFVCIQYEHFGFALTSVQVETMIRKLSSLLNDGVCEVDEESELHVDWGQADNAWVMIAFRPSENCQGRFYDVPKDAAADLLKELEKLVEQWNKTSRLLKKVQSAR